jgi:hypothetical protein
VRLFDPAAPVVSPQVALAAQKVIIDVLSIHRADKNIILDASEASVAAQTKAIDGYAEDARQQIDALHRQLTGENARLADTLAGNFRNFLSLSQQGRAIAAINGNDKAFKLAAGDGKSAFVAAVGDLSDLRDHINAGIEAVIAELGGGPLVGVGISAGASMLFRLAHAEPSLFTALVTLGAPPSDFSRAFNPVYLERCIHDQRVKDVAEIVRLHTELVYSEPEMEELRERTIQSRLSLPRDTPRMVACTSTPQAPGRTLNSSIKASSKPVSIIKKLASMTLGL